jgi:hypothetical protein
MIDDAAVRKSVGARTYKILKQARNEEHATGWTGKADIIAGLLSNMD